jgi:hypothetical protein
MYQTDDAILLSDPIHLILIGFFFFTLLSFFLYILQYIFNFFASGKLNYIRSWAEFILIFWCFCAAIPIHDINTTEMNGFSRDINYINFLINLILTIIIFKMLRLEFRKFFFPVICFVTIFTFAYNQYNFIYKKNMYTENIELGIANTLVFSFDGVPGRILNKILKLKVYNEQFNDFVLYENTFSHSPATLASMHSEILGDINWKLSLDNEADLLSFTKLALNKKKYGYLEPGFTYGYYENFSTNPNKVLKEGFVGSNYDFKLSLSFLSTGFCRIGVCMLGRKYGWLPNYVRKFKFLNGLVARSPLQSRTAGLVDAIGTPTKFVVNNKSKYGAFWGHYMFSHHPIWQNESCEVDKKFESHQVSSVTNQTKCVISVISRILDQLRQYNFYENSLIVFKSDHGKPRTYYNKDTIYGAKINDHPTMGYDRYMPFVMIKYPQTKRKKITIEPEPFFLSTLGIIYCTQWVKTLDIDLNNCSKSPTSGSVSLVDNQKYFYIPKSKNASYRYDTHKVYPVKPTVKAIENLFTSLSDLN